MGTQLMGFISYLKSHNDVIAFKVSTHQLNDGLAGHHRTTTHVYYIKLY